MMQIYFQLLSMPYSLWMQITTDKIRKRNYDELIIKSQIRVSKDPVDVPLDDSREEAAEATYAVVVLVEAVEEPGDLLYVRIGPGHLGLIL